MCGLYEGYKKRRASFEKEGSSHPNQPKEIFISIYDILLK